MSSPILHHHTPTQSRWRWVAGCILGVCMSIVLSCVGWLSYQRSTALLQVPWNARYSVHQETCGTSYCTSYGSYEVSMIDITLVHYYTNRGYGCVDRDRYIDVAPTLLPLPYWECERIGTQERAVVRFAKGLPQQPLKVFTTYGYAPAH